MFHSIPPCSLYELAMFQLSAAFSPARSGYSPTIHNCTTSVAMLRNLCCWIVASVFLVVPWVHGGERTTDSVGNDLVQSLTSVGRFDDAEWVCRDSLQGGTAGRLSHAQWSARLASVLAERNVLELFQGRSSELSQRIEPAIQASCRPIDIVLSSYPESQSAIFLAASKLAIEQRVLRAAIVAASVSPPNEQLIDDLLSRVSRLQIDTKGLQKTARDRWSKSSVAPRSPSSETESISADQYDRLFQQLSIQLISLAVLQTELFQPKTDDYRSAAAAAVTLAEQAVLALPDSTSAKRTAQALLAESLLRSGDNTAAGKLIQRTLAEPDAMASPVWNAMKVRYELALGNTSEAQRICDSYFGSSNSASGRTSTTDIEMAFARLDVLLADQAKDAQVANWIGVIQQRGGAFARRRAEAIAIRMLRSEGLMSGGSQKRGVSPSLIAAQGEDFLRRNDPGKAATFLREAALAESGSATAFVYAAKSAAAAIAAGESASAVSVLRETARKHLSDAKASDLLMQAALLASKPFQGADDRKKRIELLEDILREISQTWPTSDIAVKANAWLCRMLVQTNRLSDAAQASLELLALGHRPDQLGPAMTLWFDSLSQLDQRRLKIQLDSLSAALSEIADETKSLDEPIRRVSIWLLDRRYLSAESANLKGDDDTTNFLRQLARLRTRGEGVLDTSGSIGVLLQRARWRLQRDAMMDPTLQRSVGKILADWPDASVWQKAMAQLWTAQDDEAIDSVKRLSNSGDDRPASLRRGMELLAATHSADAKMAAIELSDRLAAIMKIKSERWYSIKLQAIGWLKQMGKTEEAQKRAEYILLLNAPSDSDLRKRFEAYAGR